MSTERKRKKTNYDAYNDFVRQIEIVDIRLISSRIDSYGYIVLPPSNTITWRSSSWYENKEGEFDVYQRYNVNVRDKEARKRAARLSVTFCVTYSSEIPMTEDIFVTFDDRNLPLNTWPYFREFTHESFARMGWTGIVAPTYKR